MLSCSGGVKLTFVLRACSRWIVSMVKLIGEVVIGVVDVFQISTSICVPFILFSWSMHFITMSCGRWCWVMKLLMFFFVISATTDRIHLPIVSAAVSKVPPNSWVSNVVQGYRNADLLLRLIWKLL